MNRRLGHCLCRASLLTLSLLMVWAARLPAQMTNGLATIIQQTFAAAGDEAGQGGRISLISSLGEPSGGEAGNGRLTLAAGYLTSETTPSAPAFYAQPANGLVTLIQDTLDSVGDEIGASPARVVFSAGQPGGGEARTSAFTALTGYPTEPPAWPGGTRTITVTGAIDDPTASVTVNGVPATMAGTTFSAAIMLAEGRNTITAEAIDPAGNRATASIAVTLNTQPAPQPTVWTPLAVTTATDYPLSGTKTAGTSIWINGVEVVPLSDATTWSATVTQLVEGDNLLSIVTKNALGNVSAITTANIIVDNLPPVITMAPPPKTNLTPLLVTGTVDDRLTMVEVNGSVAARSGNTFELAVPLTEGANPITITATSPNHHVATKSVTVTLGTIPTMTTIAPTTGATCAAGVPVTITATAIDKERDPLSFQILLDGVVLFDWTTAASSTWTPTLAERGRHTLELRVRDDFGGLASRPAQIYVTRPPISPAAP